MAGAAIVMRGAWLVLAGLLAMTATASAATVDVDVGRDDPNDPAMTFLRFFPETAVVWEGDTVVWAAKSHEPHTATSPGVFDSTPALRQDDPALAAWFGPGGFLMPGASFNATFDTPGDFAYFCKIHPPMTGVVHVLNTTTNATAGPGGIVLPGTSPGNETEGPDFVYVTAGWGSGDAVHDSFGPADITVDQGTTVVWTNMATNEPHTVTSPSPAAQFDSSPQIDGEPPWWNTAQGMMSLDSANKEFRHTFDAAGHYLYFCKIHPGMVGTVVVLKKPEAASSATGTQGGNATKDSGSRVPGLELPAVLGVLALAAIAGRRRRA
ncbi:MAG TPA: plastocyanin/azurin family copper-binding protein [Candidatus Thermoplasmatota archaeon]|nr:plastocyanin/azurin family copper-binding protein [Candidatus Thermoplasmatota archaeon]